MVATGELTDGVFANSDGVFENIMPCEPLLAILTDTPAATSRTGNFTEEPTTELLKQCSSTSSVYMLHSDAFVEAVKQPTPLVKVLPPKRCP